MTRRIPQLHQAVPAAYVEMNRADAEREGLKKGDRVKVVSRRGSLELTVEVDGRGRPPRGTRVRAVLRRVVPREPPHAGRDGQHQQAAGLQEMRGSPGARLAALLGVLALGAPAACGRGSPAPAVARSTGERANGRAYDGAPPTIPHDASIGTCVTCHDGDGTVIDGVGIAPAVAARRRRRGWQHATVPPVSRASTRAIAARRLALHRPSTGGVARATRHARRTADDSSHPATARTVRRLPCRSGRARGDPHDASRAHTVPPVSRARRASTVLTAEAIEQRNMAFFPRVLAAQVGTVVELMEGDRDRCLRAGADAYLSKPFSRHGLLDAIESVLTAFPL